MLHSGGALLDSTADAPSGPGSTGWLTTRRRRKCFGPGPTLHRIVVLDDSLESVAAAASDEVLDRRRALERLYGLIGRLRPLDRQVMLLYLEELDAASIAEITGLSAANVATKVRRIKQLLVQRFHERKGDGQ